jgi:integrase
MERLIKRGRVWYGWFYQDGKRVTRTTKCRDRAAAEAVVRQWERDAADPDHAAARTATLTGALQLLLQVDDEEVLAGRRSPDTVAFHKGKAGHLVRVFETDERGDHVPFHLTRLRAFDVDRYISARRREGAGDQTISKELVVLRKSLRLAIRAGLWRGRVEEVIPVAFSPGYEPRKRFLSDDELSKLLAALTPDRSARAAFIVATSACWRETELARTDDVSRDLRSVLLRGTKRKTRFRTVPIVSPLQRSLLEHTLRYAAGEGEALFRPWGNVRRDLAEACQRSGIERASPNDLRRTFANWYVAAGVPLFPIAQAMGHKDTRMLERVYGRQSPEQLAAMMARAMGLPAAGAADCTSFVAAPPETDGPGRLDGLPGPVISGGLVPGAGIEPATRGFSVPCSTD